MEEPIWILPAARQEVPFARSFQVELDEDLVSVYRSLCIMHLVVRRSLPTFSGQGAASRDESSNCSVDGRDEGLELQRVLIQMSPALCMLSARLSEYLTALRACSVLKMGRGAVTAVLSKPAK